MPRRFPIFQFPNPPLIAALAAGVVARSAGGRVARAAALGADAALLVWAYEEVFDGANWVRRMLGLAGGASALAGLARTSGLVRTGGVAQTSGLAGISGLST